MASILAHAAGRRAVLTVMALALALSAVACSSDGGTTTGGGDGDGTGAARRGGTLRVALPSGISGFEPLKIAGPIDDLVAQTGVYDTLMSFPEVGAEPGPMLALSATPDASNKVWTVKLREDVKFHDGTPFDAAAVKFNFDRQLDPKNGASAAAILTPLESVEVVDEHTVKFTTKFPWANFPYLLTFPPAIMASPEAVRRHGADYTNNPVGTGPYKLEKYTPGAEIVLARNPDYWNQQNAGYADKIEYKVIPNEASAYQSLAAGSVDMMAWVSPDTIAKARGQSQLAVSQCPSNVATALVIPLNIGKPPLDDARVRQALNLALDREAIAKGVFGGLVAPSKGPFAGSRWDNGLQYPGYDLARAQRLMQEYRAGGGAPVKVKVTAGQGSPLPAVLQDMWKKIGVTTEINQVDTPGLITALTRKQFDVLTWSSSVYPNPDFVFYAFNLSSSPLVLSGKGSPKVDEALNQARTSASVEEQKQHYRVVDEYMAEQSPWIWLTDGLQGWIYRNDLHGKLEPKYARPTCIPYLPEAWLAR